MSNSKGSKLLKTVKSHLHLSKDSKPEKKTVSLAKPGLPYNPYGLNNVSQKNAQQALSSDVINPISLPNGFKDPNEYLPRSLQQENTQFEVNYEDLQKDYVANGGSAAIRRIKSKRDVKPKLLVLKKFVLFKSESPESYYHRTASEFILTHSMHHVHIVEVLELVKLQLEIPRAWGMIMEGYPCDFLKVIRSPKWKYTVIEEKLCCFKQICLGLKYIHEQDICHLDLKPDNILISSHGVLKITDFGCSIIGHEVHGDFNSPVQYYKKLLGTPPYQAPEAAIYKGIGKDIRKPYCPFKFDYYSLGIMLFVIIVSKTPFLNSIDSDPNFKQFVSDYNAYVETHPTFLNNDKKAVPMPNRSIFANSYGYIGDWVRIWWRLCDPNPVTRMTLKDLFSDEWFQSISLCIDEMEYECNFIRHNLDSLPLTFSVNYGGEHDVEKVHRYGGNIRSRSNTLSKSRPHSASVLSSMNNSYKYTSLIPKTADKSPELTSIQSSPTHKAVPMTHLDSSLVSEETISNEFKHLSSNDTSEGDRKEDRIFSFQSLQIQEANKSLNSVCNAAEHHAIFDLSEEPRGDEYNFYYPDGETMHYEFSSDDYKDKEKYMIVNIEDVLESVKCVASHEHSSIMELI